MPIHLIVGLFNDLNLIIFIHFFLRIYLETQVLQMWDRLQACIHSILKTNVNPHE